MDRTATAQAAKPAGPRKTARSLRLGVLLTLVGGGLDAYTYVSRNGVFANSQSGNVVLLGVGAAQSHWSQALNHVPPILAFIVGVAISESLTRPRVAEFVRRPARVALGLEVVMLVVVGFIPRSAPDSLVTVLVAFTAAVQVSTFRTLQDSPYSTTMTTGNLRTLAANSYRALIDHDLEAAHRTRHFGAVVLSFALGAVGGAVLTRSEGPHAVWAGAVLLTLGLALFVHDERVDARKPRPDAPSESESAESESRPVQSTPAGADDSAD
jgi:uncharacterized membrane protein YoaK (UPF0700 family)